MSFDSTRSFPSRLSFELTSRERISHGDSTIRRSGSKFRFDKGCACQKTCSYAFKPLETLRSVQSQSVVFHKKSRLLPKMLVTMSSKSESDDDVIDSFSKPSLPSGSDHTIVYKASNLVDCPCDDGRKDRKKAILSEVDGLIKVQSIRRAPEIDMHLNTITFTGTHLEHQTLVACLKKEFDISLVSSSRKIFSPVSGSQKVSSSVSSSQKISSPWRHLLIKCILLCIPLIFIDSVAPYISQVSRCFHMVLCSFWGFERLTLGLVLSAILATLIQIVIGKRFYADTFNQLRNSGTFSMMALFAVGTTASYVSAMIITIYGLLNREFEMMPCFDTSAMIFLFVAVGKYCEEYAKGKAQSTIDELYTMEPQIVLVISSLTESPKITEKHIISVNPNDLIVVQPDERIPVDGLIMGTFQLYESTTDDTTKSYQIQRISVDNTVIEIDESMWTGETESVKKISKDQVRAGCKYKNSTSSEASLIICANTSGKKTSITVLRDSLVQASAEKIPIQAWADKISNFIVPGILILSVVTGLSWTILLYLNIVKDTGLNGSHMWITALNYGLSVLVVSCPCALGLATPTAILVGFSVAHRHNLLIRQATSLEIAHKAKAIIFDKTGTLTNSSMKVSLSHQGHSSSISQGLLKKVLYVCESTSRHPISSAIKNWCLSNVNRTKSDDQEFSVSSTLPMIESLEEIELMKFGLERSPLSSSSSDGSCSTAFVRCSIKLNRNGLPSSIHELCMFEVDQCDDLNCKLTDRVHKITWDGIPVVWFHFEENLAEDAKISIDALAKMGLDCYILSGDQYKNVSNVVTQLQLPKNLNQGRISIKKESDIESGPLLASSKSRFSDLVKHQFLANCSVDEKAEMLKTLRAYYQGKPIIMVGDGINDTMAFQTADVSIAISTGATLALEIAQIVLTNHSLVNVVTAVDLSRVIYRCIHLNVIWAVIYNVVAIPIAAGVFSKWKFAIRPEISAAAMMASSIIVVCSSLLLQCYRSPLKQNISHQN